MRTYFSRALLKILEETSYERYDLNKFVPYRRYLDLYYWMVK